MTQRLLTLEDAEASYYGADFSITNINISLDKGETLVVYGREGSGKTLILRTVAGLEDIKSGNIYLDGSKLEEIPLKDRDLGFTFDFSSLGKKKTVKEILEYPMRLREYSQDKITYCVDVALKEFSLDENSLADELDAFSKVRLILARLFIISRRIYIVDDIWKDLPYEEQEQIIELLQSVVVGKSVVIATQEIEFAKRLGKGGICVVAKGDISEKLSLEEISLLPSNMESAILCGYPIYMDVLDKDERGYFVVIDGLRYGVDAPLSEIYVGKKVCFAFEEGIGAKGFYYDKDCERLISRSIKKLSVENREGV